VELHQLRYLRAVVRTGSVTAAAEAEHVAQPSISKQLRLLERELGTPLFHRVGRRVVPTPAALHLADSADRVLAELAAAAATVAGPAAAAAANVRLCAVETAANQLVPPALARLMVAWPHARVSVEMLGTDDGLARVLADDVDFAVVVLPVADSRLDVHELLEEDVLLAVPPRHRWARRPGAAGPRAHRPIAAAHDAGARVARAGGHSRAGAGRRVGGACGDAEPAGTAGDGGGGGGLTFAPRISVTGRRTWWACCWSRARRHLGWVRRKGRHLSPVAQALLRELGAREL
jgi:DNA-binding transcriptional LysR family regulator